METFEIRRALLTSHRLPTVHDGQRRSRISHKRSRLDRVRLRLGRRRDVGGMQVFLELPQHHTQTEDREDVKRADRLAKPREGGHGREEVAIELYDGCDGGGHDGGWVEEHVLQATTWLQAARLRLMYIGDTCLPKLPIWFESFPI